MLCQFTVKNFQCIRDELTLDLQATPITENNNTLIKDVDGEDFLPLAVIYGPNGAGKSTVIHALYSICCKVMRPICATSCDNSDCLKSNANVLIRPFKFDKDTISQPTEYEIFFRTKAAEYQYKIAILKSKIKSESLCRKLLKGQRYSEVFHRINDQIVLHGSLKKYDVSDISNDLPLLSYLGITHRRNTLIKDVISWIDNEIEFINYGNPSEDAKVAITENAKLKELLLKMLAEMDIDISDYRIEKQDERMDVYTAHTLDGKKYELELGEESNGTIKIFGVLPYIATSIQRGSILIIDELDAKLHPLLLKYIIELYNNREINKKGAQLIFTSHDLTTMNGDLFRRDEIWFVAKTDDLSAHMYSLVEFKTEDGKGVRKDAKFYKQYLEGKYGADPYLQKMINWGEY